MERIKDQIKEGDIVLQQYKIIKKIDTGGMNSNIFLAEDINFNDQEYFSYKNKNVAIKIIDRNNNNISDATWNKFLDECVTSIRLSSIPNIVKTLEATETEDKNQIIIVMEYVDGISLRKYIEKKGSLSVDEAMFIFSKLVKVVKSLHSFSEKIIHRDLKPENILLSKDLTSLKIIDFGISSVISFDEIKKDTKILTNETHLYGTYSYLTPDILKSKDHLKITENFDFYSLGIILYEMIVGDKPFIAENYNDPAIIKLPLRYDIPLISDFLPNVSNKVQNIIFRCCASKKNDIKYRYQSIEEIKNDVDAYLKNPDQFIDEPLIKKREERTFQKREAFNLAKEKQNQKFYQHWWFYWVIITFFVILLLFFVILLLSFIIFYIY